MRAAIILAAGLSSRMGRPKQLLDWGGRPLLRHVALQALAAPLDLVLAVVNPAQPAVAAALEGLAVALVDQPDPAAGLGDSLRRGAQALPDSITCALVLLGDQPFVTGELIAGLLAAAEASPHTIAAPLIAGRRANPVLFKARWLPELRRLGGDEGARQLIGSQPDELLLVPCAAAETAADLDTPEDYEKWRGKG